jgi:preprotein translocase subunit SecF
MEFFHNPQVDWMGKKKYFITISAVLLVAGIVSIIAHRGVKYGVDFRGGTMVYVKFAHAPNLGAIRHQLNQENLHQATLEPGSPSSHELIVSLDLQTTSHLNALDAGRQDIVNALGKLYGSGPAGKVDFDSANSATVNTISEHLLADDPLDLASKGADVAQGTYHSVAQAMVTFRTRQGGVIQSFDQLRSLPSINSQVVSAMQRDFYLSGFSVLNTEIVGPKVGATLRRQAVYVVLAGLAAMLVYVWFRFELIFGVAAVVATFHDVIITLGLFSLLKMDISLTVIAAFLTLIGYSMNDTIVTFDRIRENIHLNKREEFRDLVNRSINQVLSRTILTSGLTFIAVLALFLFGGEILKGFSLVLVIGVIIGTYSSFAIASPLVLAWENRARAAALGSGKAVKLAGSGAPRSKAKNVREPAGARR